MVQTQNIKGDSRQERQYHPLLETVQAAAIIGGIEAGGIALAAYSGLQLSGASVEISGWSALGLLGGLAAYRVGLTFNDLMSKYRSESVPGGVPVAIQQHNQPQTLNIATVQRINHSAVHTELDQLGVSVDELRALGELDALTRGKVREALGVSQGRARDIMAMLLAAGFVARENDRAASEWTEKGNALIDSV